MRCTSALPRLLASSARDAVALVAIADAGAHLDQFVGAERGLEFRRRRAGDRPRWPIRTTGSRRVGEAAQVLSSAFRSGHLLSRSQFAMPKRTKSSRRWLQEHESDLFVKRAREAGFRSRAVFKLEEIQRTDRIMQPGMTIVDLGAAPGGWSQLRREAAAGAGAASLRWTSCRWTPSSASSSCRATSRDDAVLEQLLSNCSGRSGRSL